jgi:hypothetical protein
MHRVTFYALLFLAVSVPAGVLAAVLIETDEDQIEGLIASVEDERMDALLEAATFDDGGLEISAGSDHRRFDLTQREEAARLLDETTGITSAQRVRLCQRQVTVRDDDATAVLNIEVDEGHYVALRLNLTLQQGQWRLERIRVMG